MGTFNRTVIECQNPEVLKKVIGSQTNRYKNKVNTEMYISTSFMGLADRAQHDLIKVSECFTLAEVETYKDTFENEVVVLSKLFPTETITCTFSSEKTYNTEQTVVEFRNGKKKKVKVQIKPLINGNFPNLNENEQTCLLEKVEKIRLCLGEREKAVYEFILIWQANIEGAYKVKATIEVHQINLEFFEQVVDWKPYEKELLPF